MAAEISLGTLYDFNKNAMSSFKPLDPIESNKQLAQVVHDLMKKNITCWMLLNNERRDYTVFIALTEDGILSELKETLNNRGQILSIEELENESYEIWIRDIATKENFVYYLFNYEFGLIKA